MALINTEGASRYLLSVQTLPEAQPGRPQMDRCSAFPPTNTSGAPSSEQAACRLKMIPDQARLRGACAVSHRIPVRCRGLALYL